MKPIKSFEQIFDNYQIWYDDRIKESIEIDYNDKVIYVNPNTEFKKDLVKEMYKITGLAYEKDIYKCLDEVCQNFIDVKFYDNYLDDMLHKYVMNELDENGLFFE